MRFEWNESKNEENRKKHGLSFEVAIEVFGDPIHLSIFDCMTTPQSKVGFAGDPGWPKRSAIGRSE